MPRSEELKHVDVHLQYRKRASKLIRKLSERIEELEKTLTGSEVITLVSDYTNYDCAFPFVFISVCCQFGSQEGFCFTISYSLMDLTTCKQFLKNKQRYSLDYIILSD